MSLNKDFVRWNLAQAKFVQGLSDRQIARETGISRSALGYFFRRETYKEFWAKWDELIPASSGAKICLIDIETSPILGYVWGLWNQNLQLDRIVKDWYMLSYAYKWLGETDIYSKGLIDFDGYVAGDDCEEELVRAVWKVLDAADIVIAHNAVKFDIKKMNFKFLQYGLGEPSPYKIVDTLQIVKENFAATSNKLDYYTKILNGDGKFEHEGFGLWVGCMKGSRSHWDTMIKYNRIDIQELENVYLSVRGWSKKHPNVSNYYNDNKERCRVCGSDDLHDSGMANAGISVFEAVKCGECGNQQRRRVNLKSKEKMKTTTVAISR